MLCACWGCVVGKRTGIYLLCFHLFVQFYIQPHNSGRVLRFHVGRLLYICLAILCWGFSGGAKVSCILCHRGVQLILTYSWARPAILVAGKGGGGMFLFLLFLYFHSCSSFFPVPLFHLFYYLFYLFSSFLWEMTQNDPQGLTCH